MIGRLGGCIERIMAIAFTLCGFLTVFISVSIAIFLLLSGIPGLQTINVCEFLLGTRWAPTVAEAAYGILPFILSSIYGTFAALIISIPFGLLCALYLAKFANPKAAMVIRFFVDILSGIPSVVYGLIGMIIIVPAVRDIFNLPSGATLMSAIIVLSIMILPTLISISETSIRAVPKDYEQASYALGATKAETCLHIILPAAKSGIITAIVLGVGRAIGEAMAVMMVSGNVANMPEIFGSVRFLTTAIASEMSYSSGLHKDALFSIGLVLFVFIVFLNLILQYFFKKEYKGAS